MSDNPKPTDLDELVKGLHVLCRDEIDVERIKAYMESYDSNEVDWGKYAFFDDDKYTRNLVDEGNKLFNLIVLCWNRGQASTIHCHAKAECVMKILKGTVKEEVYKWPEDGNQQEMSLVTTNQYERDEVAHINDSMGLHRVSNPSNEEQTVTLHLYFPPFSECGVFNEKTGSRSTGQMTYYSKFGKKVDTGATNAGTCCGGKSCCN